MTSSEPARTVVRRTQTLAPRSSSDANDRHGAHGESRQAASGMGITVYGCGHDESALFREKSAHFGVTLTVTEAPLSDVNVALAQGNRCVSVSHKSQIAPPTLGALRDAGVVYISTRSAGYNHIDVEYARSVGVAVENVAYSPDSVADYTLMLMLMGVRHVKYTLSRGQAHDYRLNEARGRELRDLTVGVIGTGRIGAAVLERLRGFNCRVVAHDRCPKVNAEYVSLQELLQQSDVVTIHTPLNAETHHLLDHGRIEQMRAGALIVNTARGSLLDTEALLSGLERGHLGGAALDVLEGEEGVFYADHRAGSIRNELLLRLQRLPNVLITPHTAYYTDHALSDIVENTLANCLRFEGIRPWFG